ncbi:MAG: TetR/AcrR family transcriptional regulator [Actinomycetota bacterium]
MARLDRHGWLRGAFALAAADGMHAVKVEPLAKRLGVTKGSFYHHFDDRDALLAALLDYWVEQDTERIIRLVDAGPEVPPPQALRRLVELTFANPSDLDGVESAIREWAVERPEAAAVVADVDHRRLAYVTGLLVEAGVDEQRAGERAHVFYRIVIGEYLWRRYGGEPIDMAGVHDMLDWALTP